MSDILIVLAVPVMALVLGWWLGRHQVDPYTTRGRRHYGGQDE